MKNIHSRLIVSFFYLFCIACIIPTLNSCKEKKQDNQQKSTEKEVIKKNDFAQLFDGNTLKGWNGDLDFWKVENGILVGEITPEKPLKTNTFLVWKDKLTNFELKVEFRISQNGNSGINYRSELLDSIPFALRGYQADIDGKHNYTGQNYEERKRTTLAYIGEKALITSQEEPNKTGSLRANIKNNAWLSREIVKSLGDADNLRAKIKDNDWNKCHLIIKGNRLQHYINGILMSDVTDNDTINRAMDGYLGFQLHVGPPMKVEYRNIMLKKLTP